MKINNKTRHKLVLSPLALLFVVVSCKLQFNEQKKGHTENRYTTCKLHTVYVVSEFCQSLEQIVTKLHQSRTKAGGRN